MKRVLGVTGTRKGFTANQRLDFTTLAKEFAPTEFHHGSCEGVDVEAARIIRELFPDCWIVAHPGPDNCSHRVSSGIDNETRPPETHFARNRTIVRSVQMMSGYPREEEHQPRGGTWYTIDFSENTGVPVRVTYPSGRDNGVRVPCAV
jgi:hypothetical protein